MTQAYRTAYVYVRDAFAGILRETDEGYLFCYDRGYIEGAVSKAGKASGKHTGNDSNVSIGLEKESLDDASVSMAKPSAVSLTLPVREEEYTSKTLFSFFDGLIPEGWLLDVVSHNWKLDSQDRFGLLLVACKDPIGNVRIKEKLE